MDFENIANIMNHYKLIPKYQNNIKIFHSKILHFVFNLMSILFFIYVSI